MTGFLRYARSHTSRRGAGWSARAAGPRTRRGASSARNVRPGSRWPVRHVARPTARPRSSAANARPRSSPERRRRPRRRGAPKAPVPLRSRRRAAPRLGPLRRPRRVHAARRRPRRGGDPRAPRPATSSSPRDVIGRYGGTVEKFIGDAVMAVWGAPVAHEDDAERAVRAGLELVDAVRTLGPGDRGPGRGPDRRGGGDHRRHRPGDGRRRPRQHRRRLQSVAPPGAVLVGEATQRAAAGRSPSSRPGSRSLKGKAAPVPAWRALRVVAERGGRSRAETLEAPFVGRDDELRLLKDLFHATARERRPRLVSVTGPAGIGKTRLAWEFLKYIDGLVEPIWWHDGRSPAYGDGITFWALGEMVRGTGRPRRDRRRADDARADRRDPRGHVPDEDERRWIEPALLALLGIEPAPAGPEQLFGAWRTFFERIAADGPGGHGLRGPPAGPTAGLLDFIDHLLEWSTGVPIYVVTLARPELLERRPGLGRGQAQLHGLHLEPLSEPAMRELLAGLVPGPPGGGGPPIVERADGVPLYAVETVRMLLADGRLVRERRRLPAGRRPRRPRRPRDAHRARRLAARCPRGGRPGPRPRRRGPRPELHARRPSPR